MPLMRPSSNHRRRAPSVAVSTAVASVSRGNVEATLLSVGVHCQNLVVYLFALQGLSNDAANTLVCRCLEGQHGTLQQGPCAHASARGQRVVCVQAADGLGCQGQAACQRLGEGQFVGGQLNQAVTLTGFTRLNSGRNNRVGEVAQLLPRPNPSTAVLGFGAQQVWLERERGVVSKSRDWEVKSTFHSEVPTSSASRAWYSVEIKIDASIRSCREFVMLQDYQPFSVHYAVYTRF